MFIDRLLENWEVVTSQPWTEEELQFYFGKSLWASNSPIDTLKLALIQSICFDIDNVFDIYSQKVTGEGEGVDVRDLPNVKMPYPIMWFEYPAFQNEYQEGLKASTGDYARRLGALFIESPEAGSILAFHFVVPEGGQGVMFGGWTIIKLDEGNKVLNFSFAKRKDEVFEDFDYFATNQMIWYLLMPLTSISFMHCKNVTIQTEEPPAQLQKARLKRGKCPFLTFRTLEIKSMVRILREEGQFESQGLKHALHICRGHFKDFSKGSGLFGRNKGLYWWEPQVRGNIEQGIAAKDYKISPAG